MHERSQSTNNHYARLRKAGAIAGLGALLAGCTTSANSDEIVQMSPIVRFSHDYAHGWEDGPAEFGGHDARASGQDGCLDGSPYDPFNGNRRDSASMLQTPEGMYQVIPTNEIAGAPRLTFLQPQGSAAEQGTRPLVPANQETLGVLAAYQCAIDSYPRYQD
jgi:hypothetical protein